MGLITYLYRGYNPVTKYHGHPSYFIFSKRIQVTMMLRPLCTCLQAGRGGVRASAFDGGFCKAGSIYGFKMFGYVEGVCIPGKKDNMYNIYDIHK